MADDEDIIWDQNLTSEKYDPFEQDYDSDQPLDDDQSVDGDQQITDEESDPGQTMAEHEFDNDTDEDVDFACDKQTEDGEETDDNQQIADEHSVKKSKTKQPHLNLIKRVKWASRLSELERPENQINRDLSDVLPYQKNKVKYTKARLRKFYRESGAILYDECSNRTKSYEVPITSYAQTPFPRIIINELNRQGFKEPLRIWCISWIYILKCNNFIGLSDDRNGSLAYVLPCLMFVRDLLDKRNRHNEQQNEECLIHLQEREKKAKGRTQFLRPGPLAVVVTHSLMRAKQIKAQFKQFGELLQITTHLVFGEKDFERCDHDPHVNGLKKNPDILIAVCGGKLSWLLFRKRLNLTGCIFSVFDDATLLTRHDNTIRNVLGQVRPDGIVVMWNKKIHTNGNVICHAQAAMKSAKIQFSADMKVVRFHFKICQSAAPKTVKHNYNFDFPAEEQDEQFILTVQTILTAAASSNKKPKILVFCNTPAKEVHVSTLLEESGLLSQGFDTAVIDEIEDEGDSNAYTQAYKEHMANVKSTNRELVAAQSHHHIWIATDENPLAVLDFTGFDCIVHYDFPNPPELYGKRAIKLLEEVGERAAIYTRLSKKFNHKTLECLADFFIAHNVRFPFDFAMKRNYRLKLDFNKKTAGIPSADITPGTQCTCKPTASLKQNQNCIQKRALLPTPSIMPLAVKANKKKKRSKGGANNLPEVKEGLKPIANVKKIQNCNHKGASLLTPLIVPPAVKAKSKKKRKKGGANVLPEVKAAPLKPIAPVKQIQNTNTKKALLPTPPIMPTAVKAKTPMKHTNDGANILPVGKVSPPMPTANVKQIQNYNSKRDFMPTPPMKSTKTGENIQSEGNDIPLKPIAPVKQFQHFNTKRALIPIPAIKQPAIKFKISMKRNYDEANIRPSRKDSPPMPIQNYNTKRDITTSHPMKRSKVEENILPEGKDVPLIQTANEALGTHNGIKPHPTHLIDQETNVGRNLMETGGLINRNSEIPNQSRFNGLAVQSAEMFNNGRNNEFRGHNTMQANNNNMTKNNGQFPNQGNFNGNCGNVPNNNAGNNGWNQGGGGNNQMQATTIVSQNNGQLSNQGNFTVPNNNFGNNGPNKNFGNNGPNNNNNNFAKSPNNNFGNNGWNQGGGGNNQMQARTMVGQHNGQLSNQGNATGPNSNFGKNGPNNNVGNNNRSNNLGNNGPNNSFGGNGPNNNYGNNDSTNKNFASAPNNNFGNNGLNNNNFANIGNNGWNQGGGGNNQMQARMTEQNNGQFSNQGNSTGPNNNFGSNNNVGNNNRSNNFGNNGPNTNFGNNGPNNNNFSSAPDKNFGNNGPKNNNFVNNGPNNNIGNNGWNQGGGGNNQMQARMTGQNNGQFSNQGNSTGPDNNFGNNGPNNNVGNNNRSNNFGNNGPNNNFGGNGPNNNKFANNDLNNGLNNNFGNNGWNQGSGGNNQMQARNMIGQNNGEIPNQGNFAGPNNNFVNNGLNNNFGNNGPNNNNFGNNGPNNNFANNGWNQGGGGNNQMQAGNMMGQNNGQPNQENTTGNGNGPNNNIGNNGQNNNFGNNGPSSNTVCNNGPNIVGHDSNVLSSSVPGHYFVNPALNRGVVGNSLMLTGGMINQNISQIPYQSSGFNGLATQGAVMFNNMLQANNNNMMQANGMLPNQVNFNGNFGNGLNNNVANIGWNQGVGGNIQMNPGYMMGQSNGLLTNQVHLGPNNNLGNNNPITILAPMVGGNNQMLAGHMMGQSCVQFPNQGNFIANGAGLSNNCWNLGVGGNHFTQAQNMMGMMGHSTGQFLSQGNFIGPSNNFGNNIPTNDIGFNSLNNINPRNSSTLVATVNRTTTGEITSMAVMTKTLGNG